MLKRISHFLNRSGNEQEDQRRLYLTFLLFALILALVGSPLILKAVEAYIFWGFMGLLLISQAFAYRGQLGPARVLIPVAAFLLVTRLVYGGGIHDDAIGGYYFILMVAGLILGRRALLVFGAMSTLAVLAIGLAETNGLITRFGPLPNRLPLPQPPSSSWEPLWQ
jgi:hypothetical protein